MTRGPAVRPRAVVALPGARRRPVALRRGRPLGAPVRRLRVASGLLGLVLLIFCGRLIQIQGLEAPKYAAMAQRQRLTTVTLTAGRGTITDRNGVPFALTVDARDVYADPQQVVDPAATARALAPLLRRPVAVLSRLLRGAGQFVYLGRELDPRVGAAVSALNLAGIGVVPSLRRVYPGGDLASNVVGFVGIDGTGLAGLEYADNALLSGTNGWRTVELGASGPAIPTGIQAERAPVPGEGLELTIDRDIQWEAQQALDAQVAKTGAQSGTVVVMDPRTGQILALATAPGFDANHPGAANPDSLGDPAVSDVYEPGSVSKVITMSAAIEDGLVTPSTPITVPPTIQVAHRTFHDAEPHGVEHLTLTGVLAMSSNIGTIEVAERLGAARLYQYLQAYGLGQPTGLGAPGESAGILPSLPNWSGTTLPTIAFGQGVSVTALQVAAVYATIANGGLRVTPTLIRGVIDRNGRLHPAPAPATRRVIGWRTARELSDMLEAVTTNEGTAPAARIPGYRVAGKTGTAQRPDGHGGYSGYTASFVGFAPADAPQLVVEVVLQAPVRGYYGGAVAAPVFHDVMAFALASLRIPPTGTTPPVARLQAS